MSRRDPIDLAPPVEKAFLIAVDTGDDEGWSADDSLTELAALAATAGADVVGAEWQNRRHVDPNWYVGKGKAEELHRRSPRRASTSWSPTTSSAPRSRRASRALLNVKVIDRSRLILDIFALHAQTHEGRLQVELAQLEYQLPRLTRLWTHLSRTGGGIGTRGPGESQLETDRRLIRERIKKMKERVEDVRRQRETTARGRDRRLYPTVAIVGYTNAGKSTLLNSLVGSEVAKAEDKLFATLDPTSRQVKLGDGQTAIITDTVGFIHKLPHQLVDAFRATLEEVTRADVLVEVVDASDGHAAEHRATVQTVLEELGAGDKPRLTAFNKADLLYPGADGSKPGAGRVGLGARVRGDGVRARHAARGDRRAARVAVGGRRRRGPVRGRRAPRARPRAWDRRPGVRQAVDVRVTGRMAPGLAGELRAVADRWAADARGGRRGVLSDTVGAGLVRRAGSGRTAAGDRVWWSVAEGRRGRRWREAIVGPGGLRHSLLLETAPDGGFSHLELSTPAGLLTLHPEPDGTLHGNVIETGGIRHVVGLPWDRRGVVDIEGSAVVGAACARLLAGEVEAGASARRTVLRITTELLITTGPANIDRTDAETWRIAGGAPCRVDGAGLPVLPDAESWPLEQPG